MVPRPSWTAHDPGSAVASSDRRVNRRATGRSRRPPPDTLGWREWATLPDLGIETIKVKLDTGARTSSLHAVDLTRFERDGREWLRFGVHPNQRSVRNVVYAEAEMVDERWVRNSGGHRELRPVIETRIGIGGASWDIELTLTRRDEMGFRMLLGRQALRGRAVVDPSGSYRAGRPRPDVSESQRTTGSGENEG
jgi:hypothetical protein